MYSVILKHSAQALFSLFFPPCDYPIINQTVEFDDFKKIVLLVIFPNRIIREMRLSRSKELLQQQAGNASEVAFMVGFNSIAYFSKCFKDEYGLSPSEVLEAPPPDCT